ncbi:MAG: hypothetical protein ACHRXM_31770 [Isosphaerales bacterium]
MADYHHLSVVLGVVVVACPLLLTMALGVTSLLDRKLAETTTAKLVYAAILPGLLAAFAVLAIMLIVGTRHVAIELGDWVLIPRLYHFSVKFVFDRLSVPFVILSYILSGTIAAFATKYMHRERGFNRFFVLYAVFLLGMVLTSLAGTIETLFAGWELVGLSSALLVAFFQERPAPARNGQPVWVIYRVSDAALSYGHRACSRITTRWRMPSARTCRGPGRPGADWPTGWAAPGCTARRWSAGTWTRCSRPSSPRRSSELFCGATRWNVAGPTSCRAGRPASRTKSSRTSKRSKSSYESVVPTLARDCDRHRPGWVSLGEHLYVGLAVVVAAAINGIAVMRAYFLLFTGSRHGSTVTLGITPRERFAVLTLSVLILGGGVFPQPGVMSRQRATEMILRERESRVREAEPGRPADPAEIASHRVVKVPRPR